MDSHPIDSWAKGGFAHLDIVLKAVILACFAWLVFQKDISLNFKLLAIPEVVQREDAQALPAVLESRIGRGRTDRKNNLSPAEQEQADQIYNMSVVLGKHYLKRKGVSSAIIQEKLRILKAYLEEFGPIAVREMKQHGIPASITLAQGLLESDAGGSRLAKESHNHFGIKCKSKCRGCTCRNYADDDAYDMFRVFGSAEESYRYHSEFLKGKRYRRLFRLGKTDYKAWAHELKRAGYATDPKYAEKLIHIIEALKLYRYDQAMA